MASELPQKVRNQIKAAGLPTGGKHSFHPNLVKNRKGEEIIEKRPVTKGPKAGKRGYVDDQGRIWIKDRAHSNVPDHWDVQINEGEDYLRVDMNGEDIP